MSEKVSTADIRGALEGRVLTTAQIRDALGHPDSDLLTALLWQMHYRTREVGCADGKPKRYYLRRRVTALPDHWR